MPPGRRGREKTRDWPRLGVAGGEEPVLGAKCKGMLKSSAININIVLCSIFQ